jgi:hypothetical protein
MTTVLGPVPCIRCGRIVEWDKIGDQFRLLEQHGKTRRRHTCRPHHYKAKNKVGMKVAP